MITCSITTSILGSLVTILLFVRYILFLNFSQPAKIALFLLFVLLGCIPLLIDYKLEKYLGAFYSYYRYGLYFIFIGCIILFSLTLFRDALWFLGAKSGVLPACSYHCCIRVNLATVALSLVMTVWALYAGIKVPGIKEISISSDKIQSSQKLAVLSDLHIHRAISADKIRRIVERTNSQNPDIILLAGDIIDDEVERVREITALLKNLKAPEGIYFVTGNHEFYAGYAQTVSELKNLGFTFLENDGISVTPDIFLAGIPDLFSGRNYGKITDTTQAFSNALPSQFRLLMSHTPADFAAENNFDLEISGHTHGGQIFPFHIFALLHNKYLAGLYQMENNAAIYVSRGAGQWGPQMRFLAPAEITIIELTPKTKTE